MVNFIEAHVFTVSIIYFSFKFAKIKFGKFLLVSVAQKSGFSPICAPEKLGFLLIDSMLVYALKPFFFFFNIGTCWVHFHLFISPLRLKEIYLIAKTHLELNYL